MNLRVPVLAAALAGAVFMAIVLLCRDISRSAALSFITEASGIDLPQGCSEIDVFDGGEFYTSAHIRLPDRSVDEFTEVNGFSDTTVAVEPWIEFLRPENNEIPGNASLLYRSGRGETNAWLCALDRNSGRLWMVVFYPDPAGTPP